ncbi:phage tail sheath family protein [Pedobacter sp. CCM 8938]|uniref:Phage tail sheath family protein n=1 Tax=Pedobacter fastidiosus TaxID=2765361 RepID=A0ABR7KYH8_9SPHI|nr:phage tail sheath C-terminal domain-containing protein [Pedobacter fastidiosus]MBC6112865.1 phage tail sheath family protein [Pedobacter fastidiosus]
MPDYKTPGVYINEINNFPPSIATVETAIPAFIGYTEKSLDGLLKSKRINSLVEFEQFFGSAYPEMVEVTLNNALVLGDLPVIQINIPDCSPYILHYQISMFYANGGGQCYIIPVGNHDSAFSIDKMALLEGLEVCKAIDEVSLLIIPEIVSLSDDEAIKEINDAMLAQCHLLRDRFAILDVPQKNESDISLIADKFKSDLVGTENLMFGAAYSPKFQTALAYNRVGDHLITIDDQQTVKLELDGVNETLKLSDLQNFKNRHLYNKIKIELSNNLVSIYPSGAIAGIYTLVDSSRGVWKSPANISLNGVIKPLIKINNVEQDNLNVTVSGKSINAIREFPGKGILVWGGRTLNGNDNEYRYISTRRFVNMIEESIIKGIQHLVFEPNDANTWIRVEAMCENFLSNQWRLGALQGAKPEEAFAVQIGLNKTMTNLDILEGRLILQIMLAVVRPAEFLIISINQKMQES